MFLKVFFLHRNIIIMCFFSHYFGNHGRSASQIFNPLLSFDYFNPAIILIKKKLLRIGPFKVWFGTKAANIGDFWEVKYVHMSSHFMHM